MERLGKDHSHPDSSPQASAAHEEYAVPEVIITHRLRDRKMLRKRKAEAQEKESVQWFVRNQESKRRRGRGGRRGRGRQPMVELSPGSAPTVKPSQEPEPELDPLPDSQKEAKPASSKLVQPVPTIQGLVSGIQPGATEGELPAKSQNPMGEEEVLKRDEAEIPGALNTTLEIDHQDDEFSTNLIF